MLGYVFIVVGDNQSISSVNICACVCVCAHRYTVYTVVTAKILSKWLFILIKCRNVQLL